MDWEDLAARWVLGVADPVEAVRAALEALEAGSDSLNIARLAGELSPSYRETGGLFRAALCDLGVECPSREAASRLLHAAEIAEVKEEWCAGGLIRAWESADGLSFVGTEQLEREIARGHPLFGVPVRFVAACGDCRLYALEDGSGRVAEVHLGFGDAQRPPLPFTEFHDSFASWSRHTLEKELAEMDYFFERRLTSDRSFDASS